MVLLLARMLACPERVGRHVLMVWYMVWYVATGAEGCPNLAVADKHARRASHTLAYTTQRCLK